MKRSLISIFIFIFLCLFSNHTIDYSMGKHIEERTPYSLSFASIGAISLESRLDCWAKLRSSSNRKELEKYLATITTCLHLEYRPQDIRAQTSENSLELLYDISQDRIAYHIALQSDLEANETHFILSAESTDEKIRLEQVKTHLDSILGLEWHEYYLYTGEINGILDQKAVQELTSVVMRNLQATVVESYHEGYSFSFTGCSKSMQHIIKPVSGDGQSYNVQLAFHNIPSQNKTYVYIGFPLIVGNY